MCCFKDPLDFLTERYFSLGTCFIDHQKKFSQSIRINEQLFPTATTSFPYGEEVLIGGDQDLKTKGTFDEVSEFMLKRIYIYFSKTQNEMSFAHTLLKSLFAFSF